MCFGTEVLPHSRKAKLEPVLRQQYWPEHQRLKGMSCFGAAQLTVEADQRLVSGPPAEPAKSALDGRRHAACKRSRPRNVVSRGKRRAASVLAPECLSRLNRLTVRRTGKGGRLPRHHSDMAKGRAPKFVSDEQLPNELVLACASGCGTPRKHCP